MSEHGHGETAHVMSIPMLLGTFIGLIILTGITVGAHYMIDAGETGNLIIAMVIATMKAGLVLAFFMHLVYDKRYNFMIFATSVLGVVLFISISFMDVDQNAESQMQRVADMAKTSE